MEELHLECWWCISKHAHYTHDHKIYNKGSSFQSILVYHLTRCLLILMVIFPFALLVFWRVYFPFLWVNLYVMCALRNWSRDGSRMHIPNRVRTVTATRNRARKPVEVWSLKSPYLRQVLGLDILSVVGNGISEPSRVLDLSWGSCPILLHITIPNINSPPLKIGLNNCPQKEGTPVKKFVFQASLASENVSNLDESQM